MAKVSSNPTPWVRLEIYDSRRSVSSSSWRFAHESNRAKGLFKVIMMRPVAYSSRGGQRSSSTLTLRQRRRQRSVHDDPVRRAAKDSGTRKRGEKRRTDTSSSPIVRRASDVATTIRDAFFDRTKDIGDRMSENESVSKTLGMLKDVIQDKISRRYPQFFRGECASANLVTFRDMLLKGFEAVEIGCGQKWSNSFVVERGDTIMWEFFVLNHDVDFRVARRVMGDGGSFEVDIPALSVHRCSSGPLRGAHVVKEDHASYVFAFDNTYSWLRPKNVAYRIIVHKAKRKRGEGK